VLIVNSQYLFEICLGCLYFQGFVKKETRFTSKLPAEEMIAKMEETAKPLGFTLERQNSKAS